MNHERVLRFQLRSTPFAPSFPTIKVKSELKGYSKVQNLNIKSGGHPGRKQVILDVQVGLVMLSGLALI